MEVNSTAIFFMMDFLAPSLDFSRRKRIVVNEVATQRNVRGMTEAGFDVDQKEKSQRLAATGRSAAMR